MKHLTILSLSAALILFTGTQFKNQLSDINRTAIQTANEVAVQIKETTVVSDSLIISEGSKATSKAAKKIERTTFRFIGNLLQSVF